MSSTRIRVLIVDDDPWSQQVISSQLMQSGLIVDCAGDGWEAMILVGHARPDLVVTEVHLPTTDAWALAESLRSQPELAEVPVIFMAEESPGLRPGKSFRAETDQILTKPFTIVDLLGAVETALGVMPQAFAASTKIIVEVPTGPHAVADSTSLVMPMPSESWEMESLKPALKGALACFGLSSLLMVIELERLSGRLCLHGPIGTGRLALRQGHIIRARIEGEPACHGAHAIYEMLQWAKGTFEFEAGEVDGEDQIGRSTSFLLMEGARLADERAQAVKK